MSYFAAYLLSEDQDFFNRVGMCAEGEGLGYEWGVENRRTIASSPGFADAYQYALDTGVPDPGRAQEVISDGQILAAVQAAAPAPAGG